MRLRLVRRRVQGKQFRSSAYTLKPLFFGSGLHSCLHLINLISLKNLVNLINPKPQTLNPKP